MKEYPSIDREIRKKTPVYVFSKFDGSSMRAEYSRKNGWYKFGKRHGLIGQDSNLAKSISLFQQKCADALTAVFKKQRWDRAIVFFEFWGPKSFAGQHETIDDHTVTLFDVNIHKKGILHPREFVDLFGHTDIAPLLYRGNITEEFTDFVKQSKLENMPLEGVVCKGDFASPGRPLMFKIKSDAWIRKLKDYCAGDIKLFNELL